MTNNVRPEPGYLYLGTAEDKSPFLYDSLCLTTHGIVLGTTGSGKTGLCIAMLEELALSNIPVIAVDIKGDVANLLLSFPEMSPQDVEPWIDPVIANRDRMTPREYAAGKVRQMRREIETSGQGMERIAEFKDRVEVQVIVPEHNTPPPTAEQVYGWWKGRPEKTPVTVLSVATLVDDDQMRYVAGFLESLVTLMRVQTGSQSLRLVVYLDEIYGWFPPVKNTPAKRPLMTLVKQARAYGIGMLLATQNPGDLDYRGLSNVQSWFLGRLQTERDRDRVTETVGSLTGEDVGEQLAGLEPRQFLVCNGRSSAVNVIRTRQTLSFLYGPMTPDQIRQCQSPSTGVQHVS